MFRAVVRCSRTARMSWSPLLWRGCGRLARLAAVEDLDASAGAGLDLAYLVGEPVTVDRGGVDVAFGDASGIEALGPAQLAHAVAGVVQVSVERPDVGGGDLLDDG